jgi:hypothetical protein
MSLVRAALAGLLVLCTSSVFAQSAPFPPSDMWPGIGPQGNPYEMPPFQYGTNPYVPGSPAVPDPLCELTFSEAVVGRVSPGVYQLAWLNLVNKDQATASARITLFVNDGRELVQIVTLPRGRTSIELHKLFDLEAGIIAFSVDVEFTTTKGRAGITHRLSTEPWHVFNIAELPACTVPVSGTAN